MAGDYTPEQLQWLQDHIDETEVPSTHISNAVCLTAATASVILRFIARRSGKANLGTDDYCLFFAYILYVAYTGVFWSKVLYGEGRHVILVTNPRAYSIAVQLSLCQASIYIFGMLCVKYSSEWSSDPPRADTLYEKPQALDYRQIGL
ncbi:hypothetical protein JX265_011374 [Neoarthrinium moseri]|uniref:Rhodopsin domain-containing protein n=1 Tax=Neoarthrinium moseri TaxID=1658444 RepID=A0A9Q0AJT7_9PEZI|nr:hypothetical protein JX265_011374 [Neoarthrinium moseri]